MIKIKLKTVQELMVEGFKFDENGELIGDQQCVESHSICYLGKTIEANFDEVRKYYFMTSNENRRYVFSESLVKEVIQEENLFDKKVFELNEDFNLYLQDNGSLYLVLKGSHMDKHYILNKKLYKCISDELE